MRYVSVELVRCTPVVICGTLWNRRNIYRRSSARPALRHRPYSQSIPRCVSHAHGADHGNLGAYDEEKRFSREDFVCSCTRKAISRRGFCFSSAAKAISRTAFRFSSTGKVISRTAFRFSSAGKVISRTAFGFSSTGKVISRTAFCFSSAGKVISRTAFRFSSTGKVISRTAFRFSSAGKVISRTAFCFSSAGKAISRGDFAFSSAGKRFPGKSWGVNRSYALKMTIHAHSPDTGTFHERKIYAREIRISVVDRRCRRPYVDRNGWSARSPDCPPRNDAHRRQRRCDAQCEYRRSR